MNTTGFLHVFVLDGDQPVKLVGDEATLRLPTAVSPAQVDANRGKDVRRVVVRDLVRCCRMRKAQHNTRHLPATKTSSGQRQAEIYRANINFAIR